MNRCPSKNMKISREHTSVPCASKFCLFFSVMETLLSNKTSLKISNTKQTKAAPWDFMEQFGKAGINKEGALEPDPHRHLSSYM